MNRDDQTMLVIGTNIVYKTTDDVSLARPLATELHLTPLNASHPFNLAAGVSPVIAYGRPGNANLLLVGEGSNLWLSTTLQPGSLQKQDYRGANTITSVVINPNFDNVFYVADGSSVRSNTGNQGAWVTGLSLDQLQSLQFVSQGNFLVAGGYGTLYAARATDLDNWYSLKGNLPNTFVWQMDYSQRDDTMAVGTLGRGAFTVDNASTLMPVSTPSSVDRDWIRLLRSSSGDQTLNGGTVQNPDSEDLEKIRILTLTSLGGTFDTTGPNPASGASSTLTGVVTGPASLTITGNGILTLQGVNTYQGGTNLNGGTVMVSSDANLGAAAGNTTFDGGTLQTTAAGFTSARNITLLSAGGTLYTYDAQSTMSLSGVISGPSTLTKNGDGTLTLTGVNTYSGGTLLNKGILQVSLDANLGAASGPLSFNGGTLEVVPAWPSAA